MVLYRSKLVLAALTLALAAVPAQAEVLQLQKIHELAETVLGLPAESNPENPCPCVNQAPCPCPNFCPSALPACTCNYLTDSSPNLKLLGRVWYYGWAMKPANNASSGIKNCARKWLVDWHLTSQQNWGHYSISANSDEVLTVSHGQLYLGGVSAAYLFGLNGGQPVGGTGGPYPFQDAAVVNAARKWYIDEEHLWDLLDNNTCAIANSTCTIHAPGARFAVGSGVNNPDITQLEIRNQVMRQLNGFRPTHIPVGWDEQTYHTGSWILEELFLNHAHNPTQVIAPLAGHTPGPKLHDTLCIYRSGSSWLYYFPKLRHAWYPIFWVQSRPGEDPHSAYDPPGVSSTQTPVFPPVKPAPFPGATTQTILATQSNLNNGALTTCPPPTAF